MTRDGVTVEVAANIGAVEEATRAVQAGADGVGLLRTEFLFLEAESMPGEEAQERVYTEIAERLEGRPLTIRTLDVGADKPLPYLRSVHEDNPALGLRGIRLGLAQPEVLTAQLRAVVATARRHPVRVMFPMVSGAGEVDAARALLAEVAGSAPLTPRGRASWWRSPPRPSPPPGSPSASTSSHSAPTTSPSTRSRPTAATPRWPRSPTPSTPRPCG